MPRPLDYRNPKASSEPAPLAPPRGQRGPRAAIPLEFDTLLTRTSDHAAARVIQDTLTSAGIPFFRTDNAQVTEQQIELYVRSADQQRAALIAGEIFARRRKVRVFLGKDRPPEANTFTPI